MEFRCNVCNKKYLSYQSLWNHNKKAHKLGDPQKSSFSSISPQISSFSPQNSSISEDNKLSCMYCKKKLSRIDNLKRHENKCREKNIAKLKNDTIKENLAKNTSDNIIGTSNNGNNNGSNNTVVNGNKNKIIIIKSGCESIDTLSYNNISSLFDLEISSVIQLVELVNFSEARPENHSFCSTALERPYLSIYNTTTNTIDKERKKYFFDGIICSSIQKHELLYEKYKHKFTTTKQNKIKDNIANLKQIRDSGFNNKLMQEIIRKLNLLSYNKRELIQKTWNGDYQYDSDEEFMRIINNDDGSADNGSADNGSGEDDSSSDDDSYTLPTLKNKK